MRQRAACCTQVLAGSSGDGPAWPAFLHSCRSLGTRLGRHFCLVVLIHGDIDADLPWVTRLAHLSAVSSRRHGRWGGWAVSTLFVIAWPAPACRRS